MGQVDRYITCTNGDGVSVTFGETALSPFLLYNAEGVYHAENNVTISENTMSDGGAYQGSVAKIRNIVLYLKDLNDHTYNRNLLGALFKSGQPGTLVFHEEGNTRQCTYYVESVNSSGQYGTRSYTVSLLCPDPFFYAMNDVTVYMSAWISGFEFTHEFTAISEEFGYRSLERLQRIVNENASDNIGMEIRITANGNVENPSIIHVERDERITVGTSSKTMQMVAGDAIRITTSDNDKHVYLIHEGVEEEVNEYLTEESVFIQLMRGSNSIGYDAESGIDNMVVSLTYRLKYQSA